MADKKEYKLLENIRDELKENNKKEEDKAATVENGILTQKQLLAAQEELKESQKEDATKLQQLVNLAKGQKTDSGKKKMQVNIAKQQEKMDIQSESVTKQEDMMQRAADLRGVDVEVFKEMRGNLEASNDRLTEMKAQAEKDSKLGGVDFKMRKQIAQEEKRNARLAKKAEGGKLTRAKMQMKAMAKQMMTLEGIGKGIKGLAGGAAKGVGKGAAKGVKSMFGLIMKGAMLALLPAILLFFNSPLWDKTKTFLIETALPALKKLGKFLAEKFMLVFDFLKDKILPIFVNLYKFIKDEILPIFTDYIVKTWNNIKILFTDISDAFSKIFSGDILGGLMDLICGIGSFIGKQINAIMTAIYNIIASIFGLEKTDSVFGSIKGFFNNIYNNVKTFFSDMYTGFKNFLTGPIAKFFEPLTCAIMDVWDSVKAIFSGEDIMKNLAKLAGALLDIVYAPVNLAINFIRRIFGFGGECGGDTEPFRISKFIGDILRKVIEFFRGIFDFDIKGAVKKLIPGVLFEAPVVGGLLKKVFGMGDENKEEQVELESDSVTKAKIEEQRKKGNIGDITGMVDEYGGTAGALNRRQLEKDVVAGNSGGTIITTNQVSTTKNVNSQTNVSPVTDDDRVVKALTEK
jgi:hypothetical protein